MQKKFLPDTVASGIESTSSKKLLEMDVIVMKQQEIVFKSQLDLEVAVESYNRSERSLNDEFDKFCMAKFKTLIIKTKETEITENISKLPETESNLPLTSEITFEQHNIISKHDDLQKIMEIEKKKTIAKRKIRGRKWVM